MLRIAYLVNHYPKISHSFIRREIAGIEGCGIEVTRFSIRSCNPKQLVDELDKLEMEQTQAVLGVGILGLLMSLFYVIVTRPIHLVQTLWQVLKLSLHSEGGLLYHLAYLAEACVLLRWVSNSDIAHIHAHFGTNSSTVAMLCHALGGPSYSFTVHGPEEFDKVKLVALTEKIERAAFVVAVSSFGKSQLYRWCPSKQWSKIHAVHCGVDNNFLAQPVVAIPKEPRLVCVGRLCEQKGQLLLLEAVHRLVNQGLQFKLTLVGDGELRTDIESLILKYGLQHHVEIVGWASNSEVRQQILASRAMVLPSFAEGLPVALMESLALGRPVISTYVAGIPELVEPGVSGWLVPPGSIEALSEAIRTALEMPIEKLEQMGRAGAQRVAQQHNAAIEASKLAALFRSSIEKSQEQVIDLPLNIPRVTSISLGIRDI
ncbi:glycosyltransferase [Aetokthonos hydrillicola Thurmond2011]|jgi:glycosyltransferase involved in cell wall biosynthesis|uniref:Glycosyltransferase n=1 Tax=Aetokthonos hydrillicola Thurmond2011 TaxID=2712845 RepID=A0AAP5I1N8_9CYAN|nr:glycosyltransferase [Aetokthonos hydrillicola]MBO3463196.1 glycosyltransferase family 4 protein [Aetokthonos hydrillicola CCALA 1050]MBW4589571.1 glycosyltransferase [Aetokthonos hydrillicola CCALA 1050]MDR9893171.1 glycosyltransferase [Aetokthonos hydrillicola Thurmond2011]